MSIKRDPRAYVVIDDSQGVLPKIMSYLCIHMSCIFMSRVCSTCNMQRFLVFVCSLSTPLLSISSLITHSHKHFSSTERRELFGMRSKRTILNMPIGPPTDMSDSSEESDESNETGSSDDNDGATSGSDDSSEENGDSGSDSSSKSSERHNENDKLCDQFTCVPSASAHDQRN